jgi:hypothetical protein
MATPARLATSNIVGVGTSHREIEALLEGKVHQEHTIEAFQAHYDASDRLALSSGALTWVHFESGARFHRHHILMS